MKEKMINQKMLHTFYLIRDGHYESVKAMYVKALERRGFIKVTRMGLGLRYDRYEILIPDNDILRYVS